MSDEYETTLRLIGAQGHLVSDREKLPLYPKKDWQIKAKDVTLDAALSAYRQWGDLVRGVGVVCYDSLLILDFDPIEKTLERRPWDYEDRKGWRDRAEKTLIGSTYAEKSRSGTGSHFIFRTSKDYSHRRAIGLFKNVYAIDILTGLRYCDITGMRLNELPPAYADESLERLFDMIEEKYYDTDSTGSSQLADGAYPVACLAEFLDYIIPHPEDYNTWILVGIGLWVETGGSNAGFTLWDDWSRKHGSYKYGLKTTTGEKWRTFKDQNNSGRKMSVGSLIYFAKQGGADIAKIRLKHTAQDTLARRAALTMKWGK